MSFAAGPLSQWPEPLGLAAIGDPNLVRQFADIARQEYLALGLRAALHPQVDLATEPRWGRQMQTFGQDAASARSFVVAYLRGMQGEALGPPSVACTTKHFPGGGPQKDGEDPHWPYGREQVYPGGTFAEHLEPFVAAIAAGTSAIMPYYGMPVGLELDGAQIERVGFGFNRQIITGLLRERLRYDGVVLTDWDWSPTSRLAACRFPPGRITPRGRLPFELPRSMDAIRASRPDVPSDTADPLYPYRAGLDCTVDGWAHACV